MGHGHRARSTARLAFVSGLVWTPFHDRGGTLRVREFFSRGSTEFELCAQGGQMLIRRTVRNGNRETVSEAARGRPADTRAAWLEVSADRLA